MQFSHEYRPTKGYISNIPPDGGMLSDFIAAGSKNIVVLGPQLVESFRGVSVSDPGVQRAGTLNWAFGDTVLSLGISAASGSGNALLSVGKAIFLVGSGQLIVDGVSVSGVTASSSLKLLLFSAGYSSSNLFQAGLDKPSAPALAATGAGAKNTGSFSMVFTKVRTTTGTESNASLTSNVVTAQAQQIVGTFPLFSSWTDGTDAYNVYFTPAKFGTTGPWLFYKQITAANLDGSGNSTFEFNDSELTPDEPPIDFYYPPAATHVFQMGNVMNLGGTYNGYGISSSVPNYLEAFPRTSTYFLPEILVGVLGGPMDGFTLLICKGSTHAAVWTGAPDGPAVIARPLWKNIGFPTVNAVTIAGKAIYGYTAAQGMVRTGPNGEPDFEFARRVAPDTVSWTAANVRVGYSPIQNVVVYAHNYTLLIYHIDLDVWDAPILLLESGGFGGIESPQSLYTKINTLIFVSYDPVNSLYSTFTLNTGATLGSSKFELRTPWLDGDKGPTYKNIERVVANYQSSTTSNLTLAVHKNYSNTASITFTITPTANADEITKWLKANVRNAKVFQLRFKGNNPNLVDSFQAVRFYSLLSLGSVDTILQG